MILFFLILALLIAILAVIFALQNSDPIIVFFFTSTLEGSLALVLLVTFVVGVIVGVLLLMPYFLKRVMKSRKLSRELLDMHKEREQYVEDEEEFEEI